MSGPSRKPTVLSSSESDPGALWDEFCEALKQAGDLLRRPEPPRDERTIAEGYRHLMQMARIGIAARGGGAVGGGVRRCDEASRS